MTLATQAQPVEFMPRLAEQHNNVAAMAKLLQEHGSADLNAWMQAALIADPNAEELVEQVTQCLNVIQRQLESMLATPAQTDQALGLILELLTILGDVSPSFKDKLGELYKAKVADVKSNRSKLIRAQQLIDHVLQTNDLKQLHIDIINATRAALREVSPGLNQYISDLKQSIAQRDPEQPFKTAQAEFKSTTKSAIESADSGAMFEKTRKIGAMWATITQLKYVAQYEAINCLDANFTHNDPAGNAFIEQQQRKHKGVASDVMNLGGAPVAAAPAPGIKAF